MRTPTTPLSALTLCAAVATLALAGCATDPDPGQTPTPVLSWSAEEEAEAIAEAEQAIRDWLRVSTQCLAEPRNSGPSCFDEISYGDRLTHDREALKDAQDDDVHYVGEPVYMQTEKVVAVDLSITSGKEVRLSVCVDRSEYDVVRSDGGSAIPADTPRRIRAIYVVHKHASEWQVADIVEDPEGMEC